MIIGRLLGGLGNQLFVVAFNRAISIKYNIPLSFDTISGFLRDSFKRKPALDNFRININKASYIDSFYIPLSKRVKFISQLIYPDSIYYSENFNISIEDFFKKNSDRKKIFTDGYWQSEIYFKDFSDLIKDDFKIVSKHKENTILISNEITNSNAVAVHVRRINYDHSSSISFYSNAVNELIPKITKPIFFIFSDDIEWCKSNIKIGDHINYVNTGDHIEDFWLMTQCKHFIIPNSTYSWWASWLASNPSKIIITPTR